MIMFIRQNSEKKLILSDSESFSERDAFLF